jgi:hypothetical protein
MGELLDSLYKAGHFHYQNYLVKQGTNYPLETRDNDIKLKEKELEEWNDMTEEIRQEYSYLNFFRWKDLNSLVQIKPNELKKLFQILKPLHLNPIPNNFSLVKNEIFIF